MLKILTVAVLASACSVADSPEDPGIGSEQDLTSTGGCQVYQAGTPIGPGPYDISPKSQIVSARTRPLFPVLFRQGSWSDGRMVIDGNGLILPAIMANGTAPGMMSLPFDSGDRVVGVSITLCVDSTSSLIANTYMSQFSNDQRDNFTDRLVPTGSGISGGQPGRWQTMDIDILPTTLTALSTFWIDMNAFQGAQPPGPPPQVAVSQVAIHLD